MNMQTSFELLHAEGSTTPIKGWVRGVPSTKAPTSSCGTSRPSPSSARGSR